MTYEVVPYTPELEPELLRLQTHLWSNDLVGNAAYFKWKYAENPYLREPLIRIALRDGRAVAMRGLFGALWEAGGAAAQLLPYADDFVVAPADRNSGIARRVLQESLGDAARCGFPYAVSLSAGTITFVASLAAGWRSPGSYQSVRRDRSTLPRWRRWISPERPSHPAADPFDAVDRHTVVGAVSVARSARPADMADLIGRLAWDGRIRHVRDARYFAWRFRNPLHEYRFLYWDDGALQGYLVLQRYLAEGADRQRINIVDWEAIDERVRARLLSVALSRGAFARVHTWTVGATAPVRRLLRRHGFVAADDPAGGIRTRSSGLLVRQLVPGRDAGRWLFGERDMLDVGDWDLRPLYSMAG